MRLNRSVMYAICAAAQLTHDKSAPPVPCSALAVAGSMPERFLLQVMRHLVNNDICVSTRGVDGGYRLARPAGEINLAQIYEAVDGPLRVDEFDAMGLQPASAQRIRDVMNNVSADMRKHLEATTLAGFKVTVGKKQLAAAR
ncbi:RrF2 family transcriptional regulator [Lacipirellula sp.]|uniref:RrF2 family transcriptional regulator n=1 Tax=Lacipirellula sp. TaxID=2691419 RepID=UPI003D104AE8